MPTPASWHSISPAETLRALSVKPAFGLNGEEVKARRKRHGTNKLPEDKPAPRLILFSRQFKSPLVFILVLASVVTFWLGEYQNTIVIAAAALLIGAIGYLQEDKASRALGQLKKVLKQKARVIRNGGEHEIFTGELVPGDIIVLTAGNKVSADARILESFELEINEAVLTGEWLPSKKKSGAADRATPLADRDNMAYMGGIVEGGRGLAVVVGTGQNTEIGRISKLLSGVKEEKTPYQKKLARFSWIVGAVIGVLTLLIFVLGVAAGKEVTEMFTISIAIAVAAVPEGLPVAMTVILAIGMQRILAKKGLVRHITSAETLGSTTIIATDKTLTLTEGNMRVEEVVPMLQGKREELLTAAALANEAFVENPEEAFEKPDVKGRHTDRALLEAAMEAGIIKRELESNAPVLFRIPFSSETKYIASFHKTKEGAKLYVSGAPEKILELSSLSEGEAKQAETRLRELTSSGLRVVGLATKDLPKQSRRSTPSGLRGEVKELTLLGFIALKDPIRKGVKKAIQTARTAGLRTIIVTGDHALTARAVARELGIAAGSGSILEGKDLDMLSDKRFEAKLESISVFARVEPAHKLRIIEAWQKKGEVIAMTGDGVNDAPALKKADIGLALGSATDVAREASDLILLEDNFAIIPSAIKEGRVIIDNIRKVIIYLVSSSFTETILIGSSLVLGLPLPLNAVQILWINLVTGGLPSMALTAERPWDDVMKHPPVEKNAPLLTHEMRVIIFGVGIATDFLLFGLFLWLLQGEYAIEHIRTFMFAGLGIGSMLYVFSLRNLRKYLWQYNPFSNIWLTLTVLLGFAFLGAAIYASPLQRLLNTVPLNTLDWALLGVLGAANVLLVELVKWYYRRNRA